MIPGGGAVVQANYQTHIGSRVLFTLRDSHGPLPFGASVRLRKAEDDRGAAPGGMVADGGQVYLSGIPQKGRSMPHGTPTISHGDARCISILPIPYSRGRVRLKPSLASASRSAQR